MYDFFYANQQSNAILSKGIAILGTTIHHTKFFCTDVVHGTSGIRPQSAVLHSICRLKPWHDEALVENLWQHCNGNCVDCSFAGIRDIGVNLKQRSLLTQLWHPRSLFVPWQGSGLTTLPWLNLSSPVQATHVHFCFQCVHGNDKVGCQGRVHSP